MAVELPALSGKRDVGTITNFEIAAGPPEFASTQFNLNAFQGFKPNHLTMDWFKLMVALATFTETR